MFGNMDGVGANWNLVLGPILSWILSKDFNLRLGKYVIFHNFILAKLFGQGKISYQMQQNSG